MKNIHSIFSLFNHSELAGDPEAIREPGNIRFCLFLFLFLCFLFLFFRLFETIFLQAVETEVQVHAHHEHRPKKRKTFLYPFFSGNNLVVSVNPSTREVIFFFSFNFRARAYVKHFMVACVTSVSVGFCENWNVFTL